MKSTIRWFALAAAAVMLLAPAAAPAALTPGSIAFVGFNADGLDDLAFVALTPIPSGEQIIFTDNEWDGTAFNTGEAAFSWTANAAIASGTIITISNVSNFASGTPAASSNLGTLASIDASNTGVSNSDEAIWAFQGTFAAPTGFLTVMGNDVLATVGTSLTNTGLTDGVNAFFFPGDEDIAVYTGPRNNQASFAAYGSQIYTAANWISQDAGGDQSIDGIAPDVPFATTAFTLVPEPSATVLAGLALAAFVSRRRSRLSA